MFLFKISENFKLKHDDQVNSLNMIKSQCDNLLKNAGVICIIFALGSVEYG